MTVLTISKRFVPPEQVAFVERCEGFPASDKNRSTRIVLINGDSLFTEATVEEFMQDHGLNYLPEDEIALNGAMVFFSVEGLDASNGRTQQSYKARLTWRAPDGTEVIRLLHTSPAFVASVMTGPGHFDQVRTQTPSRPARWPKMILKAGRASPNP